MEGLIKHYVLLNKEPEFLPSYYHKPEEYVAMYFARVLQVGDKVYHQDIFWNVSSVIFQCVGESEAENKSLEFWKVPIVVLKL